MGEMDDKTNGKKRKTPLILAAERGQIFTVQRLLTSGADINYKDDEGKNALYWALESGQRKVANLLIDRGSDICVPNKALANVAMQLVTATLTYQQSPVGAAAIAAASKLKISKVRDKKNTIAVATQGTLKATAATLVKGLQRNTAKAARENPIGHTWLGKHLLKCNISPHWVKVCERVLVEEESITTALSFCSLTTAQFNADFLTRKGITPLGLQERLLTLHQHCADRLLEPTQSAEPKNATEAANPEKTALSTTLTRLNTAQVALLDFGGAAPFEGRDPSPAGTDTGDNVKSEPPSLVLTRATAGQDRRGRFRVLTYDMIVDINAIMNVDMIGGGVLCAEDLGGRAAAFEPTPVNVYELIMQLRYFMS